MRGMRGIEGGGEAGAVEGGIIPGGGEAVTTDEVSCSCQCLMSDRRVFLDCYKNDNKERKNAKS